MENIIAYCGLTCSECAAYIATQNDDEQALKDVAEKWSGEHGANISSEDCRCNGCVAPEAPWMSHCYECKIRACGMERKLVNCAGCADYACDRLTEFFDVVPAAKETLDTIRNVR
jgi:hypothetical protein